MATDFPRSGDDLEVSLDNSNFDVFPHQYARDLKEDFPEIWDAGGNIRGNEAFELWKRANRGVESESVLDWIREREAWSARHFEDGSQFQDEDLSPNLSNIAGIVAQVKWGTVGILGADRMIEILDEMKVKLEERQLTPAVEKGLENKLEEHLEEVGDDARKQTNMEVLEQVFDRGIGAYKTNPESVRPGVTSPEQWAYARVNSFLYALRNLRFRSGRHDTDLLPEEHPLSTKGEDMDEQRAMVGTDQYTTEQEALDRAEALGCDGSHQMTVEGETIFMPCSTHGEYERVTSETTEEIAYNRNANPKALEVRTSRAIVVDNESELPTIVGYASVFDSESRDLGQFKEIIKPGAFDRALVEEHDVRALVDHDPKMILGRSKSGTLRMLVDEVGLRVEIDPPDTSVGRDTIESIRRGDLDSMSFGFVVRNDHWREEEGQAIREINDLDLFDVSVVSFPAYEDTSVAVRRFNREHCRRDRKISVEIARLRVLMNEG
jgi:HK97 family phage prohead protease